MSRLEWLLSVVLGTTVAVAALAVFTMYEPKHVPAFPGPTTTISHEDYYTPIDPCDMSAEQLRTYGFAERPDCG